MGFFLVYFFLQARTYGCFFSSIEIFFKQAEFIEFGKPGVEEETRHESSIEKNI